VGHGFGRDIGPIEYYTAPTIPIQQPSKSDLATFDKDIEEGKGFVTKGYPPHVRDRSTMRYWDERYAELHAINPAFGEAVMSELRVLDYEGQRRWCDYSVINPNRAGGRNYVARDGMSADFEFYVLRDKDGVYIIKVGGPESTPSGTQEWTVYGGYGRENRGLIRLCRNRKFRRADEGMVGC